MENQQNAKDENLFKLDTEDDFSSGPLAGAPDENEDLTEDEEEMDTEDD